MKSGEALNTLAEEIVELKEKCYQNLKHTDWMREAWLPGSQLTVFKATSAGFCLLLCVGLVGEGSVENLITGVCILLITILNMFISGFDSYLRREEIFRRTQRVVDELVEESRREWNEGNYPHLHTPLSASVILQWVYRNGAMVNLPWALLVKGDVVLIKPGQISPARCRLINDNIDLVLEKGETFHMDVFKRVEKSLLPEFKHSVEPQQFRLEETPYLSELEIVLNEATHRPVSVLNKHRNFLQNILQHVFFPLLLPLLLAWNCFRYKYSWNWFPDTSMSTLFLIEPVTLGIPLVPLAFPAWWILTNHAALASVLQIFRQSSRVKTSDPFDDTIETPEMEETGAEVAWKHVWRMMMSSILGTGEYLSRTENILHTLGSVTSFCCSDKKGVLSWQNPSAERIFFFKPKSENHFDLIGEDPEESDFTSEILTVTHDHNNPFQVDFDDPQWKTYLPSLKPLGLSILLNTCNLWTEEKYTYFFQHLLCESAREPLQGDIQDTNTLDLLPIPGRGCLCELSSRIGFPRGYENEFVLKEQMQTFRPVISDSTGADSFTRNLLLAKLKFPFPHMVSLVVENQYDKNLQLVTQGTADIVLDSCVDVWVGNDLHDINEDARKKILEFYHRASLTSYCSAFAYRPISYIPPWPDKNIYLELPPNSSPFFCQFNKKRSDSIDRVSTGAESPDPLAEEDQKEKVLEPGSANVYSCIESQCNQTFLGMVQMQYQARVDIVQFIDLLEKACIRFVHFSKENELRSRVFSEKMGLESGWNCHISLRNDTDLKQKTKQMYSRKRATKKFSTESDSVKRFMSNSLPEKLNECMRFPDFPQFGEMYKPLTSSLDAERSVDSNTSSTDTMLQYDMSNRAQLPCGIENIRPHLDKMDNVPLLVSLFTDCTPGSTREMVGIMQENGEVVATLGSSANFHNMRIFLASDASLAVEPLYPQVCQHVSVYSYPQAGLSPTDLGSHLTAISSSVIFKRDDEVTIYGSIIASRRHVLALRHTLHFWTSSSLFLALVILSSLVLAIPSPLSAPQQLLINLVYLPLLSTGLFFSTADRNIRNMSTGKNADVKLRKAPLWYSVWNYAFRFLVPLLAVLTSHLISVFHILQSCDNDCEHGFSVLQDVNTTFISIFILLVCISFVSRTDQIWKLKPQKSYQIIAIGLTIVFLQTVYLSCSLAMNGASTVSVFTWVLYILAIFVSASANELIKRNEIKVSVRFQKRARLEFGTKLGINSPF